MAQWSPLNNMLLSADVVFSWKYGWKNKKWSTRLQVSCLCENIGEEPKKVPSGIYFWQCCHITHRRIIYYPSGVIYPQVGNHWFRGFKHSLIQILPLRWVSRVWNFCYAPKYWTLCFRFAQKSPLQKASLQKNGKILPKISNFFQILKLKGSEATLFNYDTSTIYSKRIKMLRWPSGKSVRLGGWRLWFDS